MRLHFEDWQFNCKLALSGYRGEVIPFVTQHYRVRNGSRTYRNLEREGLSRELVIDRTCMNRNPQANMLQGELLELIGKYSSIINGSWAGNENRELPQAQPVIKDMSLTDLCNLKGEEFVRAAYQVILGRQADEAGLKFYLHKLNDGIPQTNLVADMLSSAEMKKNGRVLPDEYYKRLRFQRVIRHPALKSYVPRKFFAAH